MFATSPKSPVSQPFIWVAEYMDGNYFTEFDYATAEENSFHAIDRGNLIRFGLVGDGVCAYYEILGGIFKIVGQMITAKYVVGEKEYRLIGQPIPYSDIITYKDAEFVFDPKIAGSGSTHITQFSVGYKVKLKLDDVNFSFQALCQIPMQQRARMQFKLVADKDLGGKLVISRNGREVDVVDAPLEKGKGGMINWEMR